MRLISDGPIPLYGWDVFNSARVAVTSRIGGVSSGRFSSLNLGLHVGDREMDVVANRDDAADEFGSDLDDCVFAEQVAGRAVYRVTADDASRGAWELTTAIPSTDALITTEPTVTLVMLAADCMLIALVDEAAGVLATVHAGWPGTTNGIIGAAAAAMMDLGAESERIVAAISPAVPGDRYQVGPEVAQAARAILGDDTDRALRVDDRAEPALRSGNGENRFLFDIVAAARIQLGRLGITQIHAARQVTGPGTPFYSHRFEGPTGRFALMARLGP